jgi:hypothetical protein
VVVQLDQTNQHQEKLMASDEEKIKTTPLQKMRPHRRKRALPAQRHPRLTAENQLPPHPPAIVGVKARNPFLKLIGITGT